MIDRVINDLISIRKDANGPISTSRLVPTTFGHKKANFDIQGADGSSFKVKMRQSLANSMDFSIILSYYSLTNRGFNLRRYNGNSHRHINKIEGTTIDHKFHIHTATERYQRAGFEIEGYAIETDKYHTIEECLIVFKRDFNITEGGMTATLLNDFGGSDDD